MRLTWGGAGFHYCSSHGSPIEAFTLHVSSSGMLFSGWHAVVSVLVHNRAICGTRVPCLPVCAISPAAGAKETWNFTYLVSPEGRRT